jgi:hypothetical protein
MRREYDQLNLLALYSFSYLIFFILMKIGFNCHIEGKIYVEAF